MNETVDELRRRILGDEAVNEDEVEALVVRERKHVTLTVEELLRLCVENPEHPLSKVKALSVRGMTGQQKVTVEKADLQAIAENKEITEVHTVENGRKVNRKQLGATVKKEEKAKTDKPPPAKAAEPVKS